MPEEIDLVILGAGVAGLSLASFVDRQTLVLERENAVGGLSRSYNFNGIAYDIGPHIIFSKNKDIVARHTSMVKTNRLRRANQILLAGRSVGYPFENDLSSLDPTDCAYCLEEFVNNPYERFKPANMAQFFLAAFGEGISNLYLLPYNEKIWKLHPSCLDTQLVRRIPKPPSEDIIASAKGTRTDGFLEQLYFHYPKEGGFQSLVNAYAQAALNRGVGIRTGCSIKKLNKSKTGWNIILNGGETIVARQIVNCMPLHELLSCLEPPSSVVAALCSLLYNSIHIVVLQTTKDELGDHHATYVPDKNVLFHRVSKLNSFGSNYVADDGRSTLMAEVTFRPGSYLSSLPTSAIADRVIADLCKIGVTTIEAVVDVVVKSEKYAYPIYDLDHRINADIVLEWLRSIGIRCSGRFAEFEYMNTDVVVERTISLAADINALRDDAQIMTN